MKRPKELSDPKWHAEPPKPIDPNWDRPHRQARGYGYKDFHWNICGCGYEAADLKEHIAKAKEYTEEALRFIDTSNHISYWCGIHDHCCCTDVDWAICNCKCHANDHEVAYCRKRIERWRLAAVKASQRLAKESPENI